MTSLAQGVHRCANSHKENGVKIQGDLVDKPGDLREILFPVLAHAQHGLHQLTGAQLLVAMLCPQLLITFQPVGIVLYRLCFSITLNAIKRNQCR